MVKNRFLVWAAMIGMVSGGSLYASKISPSGKKNQRESRETIDAKQLQLIDEYFDRFSFQEAEKLYWELFSYKQLRINIYNDNEMSKGFLKSLEKLKKIMAITSKKDGPGTGLENPNVSFPDQSKLFWGSKDYMLDNLVLQMLPYPDIRLCEVPRILSQLVQMPHGHKLGDIKLSADEVAVMKRNLSALMESDGKNYTFDQDFIDLAKKLKKNNKIEEEVSNNLFPENNKVAQRVQEAGDVPENKESQETVDAKQLQLIDEYFDRFSFQEAEKLYVELCHNKQRDISINPDHEISEESMESLEKLKKIMAITSKKDGPGTGLKNPNVAPDPTWSLKDTMLCNLVFAMQEYPDIGRSSLPRYLSYLVQMPHGHTNSQKGKGDTLIVDRLSANDVEVMKRNLSALMESDGKNYTFDQDFIDLAEKLKKKRNTDWEEMSKNVAPKINKVAQRVQEAGNALKKKSLSTLEKIKKTLQDELSNPFVKKEEVESAHKKITEVIYSREAPELKKVMRRIKEAGNDLKNRSEKEIGHMNRVLCKGLDNPLVNQKDVENYYQKIIDITNPKNKKDRVNKRADKEDTSSLKLRRGSSVVVSSSELEAQ